MQYVWLLLATTLLSVKKKKIKSITNGKIKNGYFYKWWLYKEVFESKYKPSGKIKRKYKETPK